MNNNKYFSQEQMDNLKKRGEALGPEKIQNIELEWSELLAKVREEMDMGTSADHLKVQQLAKRWKELIDMFSGGDPEIIRAGERFHAENPNNELEFGLDKELYMYIGKALTKL